PRAAPEDGRSRPPVRYADVPLAAGPRRPHCGVRGDAAARRHDSRIAGYRIMTNASDRIARALDSFRIELPSWGFANTGTRFGKFLQPAAAATLEEKFSDAGEVHRLTGAVPTLALHVLWDFPSGNGSASAVAALAARHGVQPGSINPNVF